MIERDIKSFLIGFSCAFLSISIYQYYNNTKKDIKIIEKPFNLPIELKSELLSRVISFFGKESFENIEKSYVIVVGLGGVGSHAANMLVRSGISKIKLIDFDQVSLSSLNRHAIATLSDVGLSKAETMKKILSEICPWCEIIIEVNIFKGSNAHELLTGNPQFVLDCIDDINTKGELIAYCVKNDINVITCMGAGAKADPTKLRIAPLSDCINDPLASKIKWKLRKLEVSSEKVMSIFSIEKPIVDLLPLDDEQALTPQDYGNVDYFRIRVMPVLGTSPSIFGQAMASYVLCQLANQPFHPEGFDILSKKLKVKMRTTMRKEEIKRFKNEDFEDLHDDDLEFIIQTVWKSRCSITRKRFFGPTSFTITRWDATLPPTLDNFVLLTIGPANQLASLGKNSFEKSVIDRVEARLSWARLYCKDSIEKDYKSKIAIYSKS